jgi:hypothetical protein
MELGCNKTCHRGDHDKRWRNGGPPTRMENIDDRTKANK